MGLLILAELLAVPVLADAMRKTTSTAQNPTPHRLYSIRRIIDGQTIELGDGSFIRLIGIDANWDDAPHQRAETTRLLQSLIFGQNLQPNKVVLDYDEATSATNHRDHHDGILAFVCGGDPEYARRFLDSPLRPFSNPSVVEMWGFLDLDVGHWFWRGKAKALLMFLNATLIKAGYARATRDQHHRFYDRFLDFETEARTAKRGLWGKL